VLNNLAQIAVVQNDPKALELAQRAFKGNPNDALIIDTLGTILVRQGQVERGIEVLRNARLRNPGNPEIRYHLAAALAKQGKRAEASEELAQALKIGQAFDEIDAARKLQTELASR
jgi:predicted Zn-dependent protease